MLLEGAPEQLEAEVLKKADDSGDQIEGDNAPLFQAMKLRQVAEGEMAPHKAMLKLPVQARAGNARKAFAVVESANAQPRGLEAEMGAAW